jgi:hypothetical protein
MADIFDVTGTGVYATKDPGGDLEVAGSVDSGSLDDFIEGHGGINVTGFDGSREKAAAAKKAIEESLRSGYVKYMDGPMRDVQENFIKQNAGKARLRGGYADAGLYSADIVGPNGEVVALQEEGSKRSFFDATGKRLSASQVANTETGKGFAAAGWDIGFGPGMIAPGVKADTTARDAARAAREAEVVQSSRSIQTQQEQPDVDPIPLTSSLLPVSNTPPPPPAKTAPIDTVLFEDSGMSIEIMTDLIFEDIGGHELLSISRNDIINGQQISYSPIKNLGLVQQRYNPNNILGLQSTSDKYFANFVIKLEEKVPLEGSGLNGLNVYIEEETGDLIIETVNMNTDEQLEVQVAINGTIYEANFGEITS